MRSLLRFPRVLQGTMLRAARHDCLNLAQSTAYSAMVSFALASVLVVFGHFITEWVALHLMPFARTEVYVFALLIRWCVALIASVGIIGLIYHMGTPMQQSWKRVLPGAIVSTVMWFLATLIFGWYVTRFANYSQVYGSLGA